jgi:hypothetical protein
MLFQSGRHTGLNIYAPFYKECSEPKKKWNLAKLGYFGLATLLVKRSINIETRRSTTPEKRVFDIFSQLAGL